MTSTDGIDLVVMPYHDYRKNEIEGFRGRDSHFLEMLIADSKKFRTILVIDRPISIIEHYLLGQSWHVSKGEVVFRGWDWRVNKVSDRVFVLSHLAAAVLGPIILRRAWWDKAFASRRFSSIIKKVSDLLSITEPVVLLHHPFGVQVLKSLGRPALVFDAMDNFLLLRQNFEKVQGNLVCYYDAISRRASHIFAVTEKAATGIFGSAKNIEVLPNGVSPEFIRKPAKEHAIRQLREMARPIIGYIGALTERVDVHLIAAAARALPECSFVLAGPALSSSHFAELNALPNVHFVGFVPYDQVPALIRDFDYCMVPHVIHGHVHGDGDSIKLYEYIAAGKPIVTTAVEGVERFSPYVKVVRNGDEFAAAIGAFNKASAFSGYPANLLQGLTWQDRFDRLVQAISQAGRS